MSAEEVLRRAVYMCAVQLAREPLLRATLRDALRERATISVRPTPRGMKEIDENHACFGYYTSVIIYSKTIYLVYIYIYLSNRHKYQTGLTSTRHIHSVQQC